MNEVSAAMGLTSLESLEKFVAANYRNYKQYQQEIAEAPGISVLPYDEGEKCNYQYVVLEIDEDAMGINRDELDDILWAENVLTRRYFYPGCHRMEPYHTDDPQAGLRLPHTERLAARVLCLPTGSGVSSGEVCAICDVIKFIMKHATALKERFLIEPIFRHPWRSSS